MAKGKACKIDGFKYPSSDNIGGRTSTICRSMACTLVERVPCSKNDEALWKSFFPDRKCAYCGKPATHLDHLFPLVIERKPTGYGTEPANLVPCCSSCNQSKGNLNYVDFMRSDLCHHIDSNVEERINNIKNFQLAMPPHVFNFTKEMEEKWNEILHNFDKLLNEANLELKIIKDEIYK